MYGFVEPWITDVIGVRFDPYPLGGGAIAHIVDKATYLQLIEKFREIYNLSDETNELLMPNSLRSSVAGMFVPLMRYWVDESILHALTDGPIKQTPNFMAFMDLQNPRFDFDVVKNKLASSWSLLISRGWVQPHVQSLSQTQPQPQPQPQTQSHPQYQPVEVHTTQLDATIIQETDNISRNFGDWARWQLSPALYTATHGGVNEQSIAQNRPVDVQLQPPLDIPQMLEELNNPNDNLNTPSILDVVGDEGITVSVIPVTSDMTPINPVQDADVIPAEPVEPPAPPPPQKTNEELFIESFSLFMTGKIKSEDSDSGYKVMYSLGVFSSYTIENYHYLAESIKRNIIAISDYGYVVRYFKNHADIKTNDIAKHTIFINFNPTAVPDNAIVSKAHTEMVVCLGETFATILSVKGADVNRRIAEISKNENISDSEKAKLIQDIVENKETSPYFKYDCVFKDTYTNVVFAVRDRCFIHMLYKFSYEENSNKKTKILLSEIGRRFEMNIPYEDIMKIDKKYFDDMGSDNRDLYVDYAVSTCTHAYDELKSQFEQHKSNFTSYLDQAMESGKLMQRFQDQISAFDVDKFKQNERDKAAHNYEDAMAIDKISCIFIEDKTVHVYTKNIYVKDPRSNKWHDIGTFHITLGMFDTQYNENNTVRIFNTKYTGMGMSGEFQAPHVWGDGHICHGNMAVSMAQAYRQRNLFDMVYQIIIFLSSVNVSDGAGTKISTWPEVPERIALGDHYDAFRTYNPITEQEKKFDEMLAEALPIHVNTTT